MYFEVINLQKTWPSKKVTFSCAVQKSTMTCLLGPSGSGKSTILNIIAGLELNDKNIPLSITLDNKSIEKLPPNQRELGFVFQNGALFEHLSVVDNVAYGLISKGMPKKQARLAAAEYLSYFELSGYEKREPQTLSGGEKQRVALARTLITKPKLVLLDEPFSALDTKLRIQLAEKLKVWQKEIGFTALMVTHDLDEANKIADNIINL